jgi:hydrogenase/urease accessory protein HupE
MSPHLRPSRRQLAVAAVYVLVSAPALIQGWAFGQKIGGWPMALVTALNTWLITVLVVGGLMDSAWRRWQRERDDRAAAR